MPWGFAACRLTGPRARPEAVVLLSCALLERLTASARVTVLSAPAGSGKTVPLRSWMSLTDLTGRVGWVPAGRDERDPQPPAWTGGRSWNSCLKTWTWRGGEQPRCRPDPGLVERHARGRTSHAGLVAELQSLLAARKLTSSAAGTQPLREPLSESELRVLRYLPTNLTMPEIASELGISRNTMKVHTRNLYAKLGTHRRAEAVDRARALGS